MNATLRIATMALSLLAGVAFAADAKKEPSPKQAAQQEKMKACNKEAGEKALKGDARQAFMKTCLSANGAAAPAKDDAAKTCEAKAAEKKLAGAAKASFVKKCETDAAAPAAKAEAKPAEKAAEKPAAKK